MSRNLSNWTFREVHNFLLDRGFTLHHKRGSHFYFKKYVTGKIYMTHVQYHGAKSIPPGTMSAIIRQSGITRDEWLRK